MSETTKQKSFKEILTNYLKVNFSKKNNIWRAIWFAIATVVVLALAIPLNI
jgi:ABC-type transport system involved in cytochrome c biogenesis permease component